MKLWHIWQDVNKRWDTYDSAIVAAETEDAARNIRPGDADDAYVWASFEDVYAELIGVALPHVKEGVILARFNAG